MNKLLELCYKHEIKMEACCNKYTDTMVLTFIRPIKNSILSANWAIALPISHIEDSNHDVESFLCSEVIKQFGLNDDVSALKTVINSVYGAKKEELASISETKTMWPDKCAKCNGQGVTYGIGGMHICSACHGSGHFISNEKEN